MKMSLFELLDKYYIVIPLVQRDYAQGREVGQVPQIRKRFIRAIFNALNSKNGQLELDFIYGSVKNGEYFMPLDGQQRLTTLFLLYWYVAVKEGHIDDNKSILAKFSYETRHSSTVFCEKLVEFV
jgi:predicted membrane GTPase involved in stress response